MSKSNNPYRANWTGEGPLRKFVVPQRKIDTTNREITFTISTSGVDRDGDILDQAGWELGNYIKNPVVLRSPLCPVQRDPCSCLSLHFLSP